MNFSANIIKSKKLVATFIVFSFVAAVFLGVHFTMNMDSQGEMQNCPVLGQFEKDCPMKVTEHISKWQQLLTATFQPNILSELLLVVASLAFSFIALRYPRFLSFQKTAPPFAENYILAAFSEGILRKIE